ncbi:MucBP domain-containing protein [Enterococcus rotai]|uniref:MucBP domain-containing protein n=1 Tax=Enterococcus rotai TaxID=118060 RepID=UPI0032B45201
MINRKKTKVFLNLSVYLISIVISSILLLNFSSQIKAEIGITPTVIAKNSYKNWESADLITAQDEIKIFLTAQKSTNVKRPYQGNKDWTEGSLAALEKAYQSSLAATSGVSSDLSRMLLIETVHKLEQEKHLSEVAPTIKSLNNFPSDTGQYDLEYSLPTVLGLPESKNVKYDVMFVLDWSGSMDGILMGLPAYPDEGVPANKPRLHAKHLITELSQLVLNNYQGSRIRLFGLNAPTTNADVYVNIDTGFFGNEVGWESKVKNAYNTTVANNADNQVGNLKKVVPIMKADRNPSSVPVIIYLTDFQLYSDRYPAGSMTNNPLTDYRNILTEYSRISPAGDQGPIYLAVRYDHNGNYVPTTGKARWAGGPVEVRGEIPNYTYNMLQDEVIAGRKNWNWMAITANGRTNSKPNAITATEDFMKMFTQALPVIPSRAYKADINFQKFSYVSSSLISKGQSVGTASTKKELIIANKNDQDKDVVDTGSFKAIFDDASVSAMGMNSTLGTAINGVTFTAPEYENNNLTFQFLPSLFHPYTEGAIEVYLYNGKKSASDPANYELKKTIVGTNYQPYSGTNYPLKDSRLSSLKYGSSLSKAMALNIVKDKLGASVYNKFDFSDSGNTLTASSHKMTFDAAKNVYKLYAESNESQVVVEYYDETTGTKIKENKTLTGIIGAPYMIVPKNEIIPDFDYIKSEGATLSGNIKKEVQIIKLFYRKSEVSLTIHFVDDDGVPISGRGPIVLITKPNRPVDLTKESSITNVLKSILNDQYELLKPPEDEKNVMVPIGGDVRTYIFRGQISIGATKEMFFKTGTIQSKAQVLEYASTEPFLLNIEDKRGRKEPADGFKRGQFKISGSVSKPFTHNMTGAVLNDAQLIYNDGKIDYDLSVIGGSLIYRNNTVRPEVTYELELANQTDKKNGLRLIVPKRSGAIKGNYSAEITWNIVKEPS